MRIFTKLVGSVGFATAIVFVASGPNYHRMRPRVHCSLPVREYQFREFSPKQIAISRTALLVPLRPEVVRVGDAPLTNLRLGDSHQAKVFQFVDNPILRSNHCSVSQMAVVLEETGHWSVSLQADQNPLFPIGNSPLNPTTIEPTRLFTDHMQRNQFYIRVRGYVTNTPRQEGQLLGDPVAVQLEVPPFWVQKGRSYPLHATGFSPEASTYFDVITHVELEFFYAEAQ